MGDLMRAAARKALAAMELAVCRVGVPASHEARPGWRADLLGPMDALRAALDAAPVEPRPPGDPLFLAILRALRGDDGADLAARADEAYRIAYAAFYGPPGLAGVAFAAPTHAAGGSKPKPSLLGALPGLLTEEELDAAEGSEEPERCPKCGHPQEKTK